MMIIHRGYNKTEIIVLTLLTLLLMPGKSILERKLIIWTHSSLSLGRRELGLLFRKVCRSWS